VELTTQNGKRIGKLEQDGRVWYWEAHDEDGACAAGWTWTVDGALEKVSSMREGE
jgi:hypothetical protein